MSPRDDSPPLILRVVARGIVPATALDAEILAGMRVGSDLQARILRAEPSKALRAWWALCNALVKLDPQRFISGRAVSNWILLKHHLIEEEQLIGGHREVPMSLTSFTEQELWRLVEAAKLVIAVELVPGLDVEELMKAAKRGDI